MLSNKIIKCLIIDDEAPARRVIEKYLTDISGYKILAQCKNAIEAQKSILELSPDLIFLDINMPKISGLEMLRTLKNPPLVVVTTAYREHAFEGFELNVIDYLHKPFSFDRMLIALEKVDVVLLGKNSEYKAGDSPESFIFIKEDRKMHRIDLIDINHIEAVGDYVKIATKQKNRITYMSMKKMEILLPSDAFCRIHKSYIVNLSNVTSIEGNRVFLGEKKLPIGQNYRSTFLSLIKKS